MICFVLVSVSHAVRQGLQFGLEGEFLSLQGKATPLKALSWARASTEKEWVRAGMLVVPVALAKICAVSGSSGVLAQYPPEGSEVHVRQFLKTKAGLGEVYGEAKRLRPGTGLFQVGISSQLPDIDEIRVHINGLDKLTVPA